MNTIVFQNVKVDLYWSDLKSVTTWQTDTHNLDEISTTQAWLVPGPELTNYNISQSNHPHTKQYNFINFISGIKLSNDFSLQLTFG